MTQRVVIIVIAATLLLAMCSCQHASTPTASPVAPASAKPAIQTKAIVFDLADPDGTTSVGIMGAFDPLSHSFWWRPVPMIAAPEMLERYFERCKFERDGVFVVNFCVRGNEVVVTTTADHAASLENGLPDAQEKLKREPGLLMGYQGPRDIGFDLQHNAGVDMNTPEGCLRRSCAPPKAPGPGGESRSLAAAEMPLSSSTATTISSASNGSS